MLVFSFLSGFTIISCNITDQTPVTFTDILFGNPHTETMLCLQNFFLHSTKKW
ncbi:hypothetical protein X975_00467, partial [Stegodyphus mimosarum]